MRKRTIVISLSAVAAAATTGGAYAATRSSSSPRAVARVAFARPGGFAISEQKLITDAARRLNVSPSQLTGSLKQALIDQINAEVKAHHLPAAQANAIKKRIEASPGLPFGPGLFGPGPPFGPVLFGPGRPVPVPPCPRGKACQVTAVAAPGIFGPPALLPTAAQYLGLSLAQLTQELRSGKTLAQIAQARAKSTSGLEQAIGTAIKSELEKSFAAQRAMEQRFLAGLPKLVHAMVNSRGPIGPATLKGGARLQFRFAGAPPMAWSLGLIPPPRVRAWVVPQKH